MKTYIEENLERLENQRYWSEHCKKCLSSDDLSSFFGIGEDDPNLVKAIDDIYSDIPCHDWNDLSF